MAYSAEFGVDGPASLGPSSQLTRVAPEVFTQHCERLSLESLVIAAKGVAKSLVRVPLVAVRVSDAALVQVVMEAETSPPVRALPDAAGL